VTSSGPVSGEGRLSVGNEDLGGVDYVLRASKHGETIFVAGQLTGNPKAIIRASAASMASMRGDTHLSLENGHIMKIHVYQATVARGLFQASGAVPRQVRAS
jgi:hypothetical protein